MRKIANSSDRFDVLLRKFEAATPSLLLLTDANFERTIRDAPGVIVVQFYARNCAQCHRAADALEQVAASGRSIYKVDSDVSLAVTERFFIRSFPKILMFRRGALKGMYAGPYSAETIEAWIAHRAGPLAE